MNRFQAKQRVLQAIREDAVELNLSSIGDENKLDDADLEVLLTDILKLENLEMLDLSSNQLTKFDKRFIQLENLRELDLSENQLISFDINFANLQHLQELDLRNNNLPFPNERLNAYGNPNKIFDFIYFKHLVLTAFKKGSAKLNLNGFELTNSDLKKLLPDILELENLQALYLNDNRLTVFDKEFARLRKLRLINLSNNKITFFDKEFAELESLQALYLRSNRLVSFDKNFTKLKNLKKLDLRDNSLPFPNEILLDESNPQKILNYITDYYAAQEKGNLKKLNEAKLVVIGESNVGKTCIINRLIDNKFIETDSTHGIQIRRWNNVELKNEEKVQMNVWDFGGQEIMHSTHQFFFTKRTIYILVVNARENEDTNKTEEWLQRIQNLSQNSPVFIVGNKVDENNRSSNRSNLGYFDIERRRLREKFPNLVKGIFGVSSDVSKPQYDVLFSEFKTALVTEIEKLKNIHDVFPESWFEVKAELEKMQQDKIPYISFQNYITRCVKAEIEKEESQRTLIEFMHDLGIALSFQEDRELRDLAVLNPEWVTRGVYALIDNSQITSDKGVLQREMLGSYLNKDEYPSDTQDFIIKMMRKFRLLIDIQKDKTFLIPDLLPKDEPEIGRWNDTLHFQYNYDIYEKSILRRVIVEMFHLRAEEIYWRNGIILKNADNRALVKADVQDKTISIKIDGNSNTRREFIAIIRNKFDEIHASFDGLALKEMLGHPRYPEVLRDYYRLRSMEDDSIEKEYVEELRTSLPVKEWLNGFYSLEERQKRDKNMENNKLKVADNITITGGNVSFAQQERGKIEINQSLEISDIEEKTDLMLSKLNESQRQDMEGLAKEIVRFFDEKFNELNEKQRDKYELAKKGDWKGKIKLAIPLIHHLGISVEIEKEIKPDEFIIGLRKMLYGKELEVLSILNS